MATETPKQKPVKQYRRGAIGVSIWKREAQTKDGIVIFYSATPSRAFTKDDGKSFQYSDSFDADDLPVLSALLTLAYLWIASQTNKD